MQEHGDVTRAPLPLYQATRNVLCHNGSQSPHRFHISLTRELLRIGKIAGDWRDIGSSFLVS